MARFGLFGMVLAPRRAWGFGAFILLGNVVPLDGRLLGPRLQSDKDFWPGPRTHRQLRAIPESQHGAAQCAITSTSLCRFPYESAQA